MNDYPSPRLVPTAAVVMPGQPLPLQVRVDNPTSEDLIGATAELTLEVERGVLVSWQLGLAAVPAGSSLDHAIRASQPAWELPLNVAEGQGQFAIRLFGPDGAWLNEHKLELPVQG